MREIKFRVKDINGEWHKFGIFAETLRAAVINPTTLGQYTGLRDKNGAEIYEGDIVKTKYHELRDFGDEVVDYYSEFVEEIVWLPAYNGFGLQIMIEDIPMYRALSFVQEVNGIKLVELEVIGNIHDNPELLEVDE